MKNKKLRILIVITFIFALFLTFFSLYNSTYNRTTEITPPGHTMYWPPVYDEYFNDSIIDYNGNVDTDILEEKFEKQFEYEIEHMDYEIDPDFDYNYYDYEFQYSYEDGIYRAYAINNLRDELDITNPTHTYKYKLQTN